jgi:hypothetical protein
VNKKQKQAHVAFQVAINGKIQGSRHAIKFIGKAIVSFLKMRTSNLAVVANAMESEVKTESNYKQIQRFLKSFKWRQSGFADFQLQLLGITDKLDLVIDRTEWKFGKIWINLLMVSVVYRGVSLPLSWKVFSRKGNLSGKKHVMILRNVVNKLGKQRVGKVCGDREFCNKEVLKYLYENKLDFCIRLKKSYLANGVSFKELCVRQSKRVKIKGKRKLKVLGYEMGVSCEKLSETEYLIVGTREVKPNAFAEYKKRWGIETLFGCLKSRGFDFEETHLTKRVRIERLTFLLSLAVCLAIKTGEIKTKGKSLKKKNNGRASKSLFRIGLDYLQNLLVNLHFQSKWSEFNILANLLSCT